MLHYSYSNDSYFSQEGKTVEEIFAFVETAVVNSLVVVAVV